MLSHFFIFKVLISMFSHLLSKFLYLFSGILEVFYVDELQFFEFGRPFYHCPNF